LLGASACRRTHSIIDYEFESAPRGHVSKEPRQLLADLRQRDQQRAFFAWLAFAQPLVAWRQLMQFQIHCCLPSDPGRARPRRKNHSAIRHAGRCMDTQSGSAGTSSATVQPTLLAAEPRCVTIFWQADADGTALPRCMMLGTAATALVAPPAIRSDSRRLTRAHSPGQYHWPRSQRRHRQTTTPHRRQR